MDARLEAHLLRTLLEEPWDDIAPDGDDDALQAYCRTLWALVEYNYTDEGIAEYESTLTQGERFSSVARFRSYLASEIEKKRTWLFRKSTPVASVIKQRRVVR